MRTLKSARLVAVLVLFAILASAFTAKASLPQAADARPSLSLQTRLLNATRVSMPRSVGAALTKALFAQGMSRAILISDDSGNLIYYGDIQELEIAKPKPGNPCCQGEAFLRNIEMSSKLRQALQNVFNDSGLREGIFTLNANGELVRIGERHELEKLKQDARGLDHFFPNDGPNGPPGEG